MTHTSPKSGKVRLAIIGGFIALGLVAIWALAREQRASSSMPGMQHEGMQHEGMDMSGDMDGMSGHEMAPVDTKGAPMADPQARGAQPLSPTIVDGVREFALRTSVINWHILPKVMVGAYAYNGQVPGPTLRIPQNERVRIKVTNDLPEPTTVHWHGLEFPNQQDGVPEVSQKPIQPGETFVYDFTTASPPGTYFYHSHFAADRQQSLGLYGALRGGSVCLDSLAGGDGWIPAGSGCRGMRQPGEAGMVRGLPVEGGMGPPSIVEGQVAADRGAAWPTVS